MKIPIQHYEAVDGLTVGDALRLADRAEDIRLEDGFLIYTL